MVHRRPVIEGDHRPIGRPIEPVMDLGAMAIDDVWVTNGDHASSSRRCSSRVPAWSAHLTTGGAIWERAALTVRAQLVGARGLLVQHQANLALGEPVDAGHQRGERFLTYQPGTRRRAFCLLARGIADLLP